MTNAQSIDRVIDRLRELSRPGALPCAWRTATCRRHLREVARGELEDVLDFEFTDEMIRAEFQALVAESPDAPVCPCHAKEKAAALAALGQPAAAP